MGERASKKTLVLAALVVVSVAAIAMSAATIADVEGSESSFGGEIGPVDPGEGGGGNGSDGGGGPGLDRGNSSTNNDTMLNIRGCNDLLSSTPGTLAFFGGLVGVLYLIKRRFSFGFTMLAGYAITPIAFAVYFLRTQCGEGGAAMDDSTLPSNGTGGDAGPVSNVPPSLLVGGFAVLFIGVAAALYFSSGNREVDVVEEDDEAGEADVSDIAAAAAAAAERLEARDADVDNEVYRAWWDMTQLLNVSSPETYTPGEFAEAAVEVGIAEEHVDPLTTLFEEVRYGHRDPESREERAIEVFRRIEQYGDGANDAGTEGEDPTDGDDGQGPEGDR